MNFWFLLNGFLFQLTPKVSFFTTNTILTGTISPIPTTESALLFVRRPPQITITPDSAEITVYQGDPLNLVCSADGFPTPRVQWRRSYHALPEATPSTATLQKSSVSAADQGEYVCSASNEVATTMKKIKLKVRPNPPLQYKLALGDGAKISCEVDNSTNGVFWRRQGGYAMPTNSRATGGELVRIIVWCVLN